MKSTIRVDFQGPETQSQGGFEPVIRVNLVDSDDTRDRLLKTFFQSLGGESSWLAVRFGNSSIQSLNTGENNIVISPVKVSELEETRNIIDNRLGKAMAPQFFSRFSIGTEVAFTTPKAKDYAFEQEKLKTPEKPDDEIVFTPDYFWGKIVAVKFTEAKVWYDILDDYSGKVFEEIASHDVKIFSEETKMQLIKQ